MKCFSWSLNFCISVIYSLDGWWSIAHHFLYFRELSSLSLYACLSIALHQAKLICCFLLQVFGIETMKKIIFVHSCNLVLAICDVIYSVVSWFIHTCPSYLQNVPYQSLGYTVSFLKTAVQFTLHRVLQIPYFVQNSSSK